MIVKTIYKDKHVCFCIPKRRRVLKKRIRRFRNPIIERSRFFSRRLKKLRVR